MRLDDECPVCLDPLDRKGLAAFKGACGHAFHVACLNRSVAAGNKSSCPLCNRDWETDRVVVTSPARPRRPRVVLRFDSLGVFLQSPFEQELPPRWKQAYAYARPIFIAAEAVLFACSTVPRAFLREAHQYPFGYYFYVYGVLLATYLVSALVNGERVPRALEARRPFYCAMVALEATGAMHALSGRTALTSFWLCAAHKAVARVIMHADYALEAPLSWGAARALCCAVAAATGALAPVDRRVYCGLFVLLLGLYLENRISKVVTPARENAKMFVVHAAVVFVSDVVTYAQKNIFFV
jgi:hypothetical protein